MNGQNEIRSGVSLPSFLFFPGSFPPIESNRPSIGRRHDRARETRGGERPGRESARARRDLGCVLSLFRARLVAYGNHPRSRRFGGFALSEFPKTWDFLTEIHSLRAPRRPTAETTFKTTKTTTTGGRIVAAVRGTGTSPSPSPRRTRSATTTGTTNREEGYLKVLEVRTTAVRGDFIGDSPSETEAGRRRVSVQTHAMKKDASAAAMSASAPAANVGETSAETDAGARERVRFYELCSPRMLGQWLDDQTCVVNVRGGVAALRGAGEEMMRYLRDRLGVVMEVDAKRERVLITHSASTVVIEAARILHLQLEQAKLDDEAAAGPPETPSPTTFETNVGIVSPSSTDDAAIAEVMREIDATTLEELRRRLESKRATRHRLIETLGEPRVTCHLQPIELENTLVRVRLPRKKSFNEEKRYAIGVALRAVASFSQSTGKPTWIFQCDMGGAKPIETDVIYLSNDAITIPEVCRLILSRRNAVDEPKDVVDELLPPASEAPASA